MGKFEDLYGRFSASRKSITRAGISALIGGFIGELFKERILSSINNYLDERAKSGMTEMAHALVFIFSHPWRSSLVVLAFAIGGILIHDYTAPRRKPGVNSDEPRRTTSDPITDEQLALCDGDPRIDVEFVDERKNQIYKKTALILANRGGSEALDVHIDDIQLRGRTVRFPHTVGAIAVNNRERFNPETDQPFGMVNTALFVTALIKEWESYHDLKKDVLSIPLKITYTNFSRSFMFMTKCSLVFHPFAEILHHPPANQPPIVSFRDFVHSKERV